MSALRRLGGRLVSRRRWTAWRRRLRRRWDWRLRGPPKVPDLSGPPPSLSAEDSKALEQLGDAPGGAA